MIQIKIGNRNNMLEIVERILYFNHLTQSGQGIKLPPSSQMLSRLPISLAQLKQEVILKNVKTKLRNYCVLCTDLES